MTCPHCHAEDNTGVFFLCGTDSSVFHQSEECKRRVRDSAEDIEVDDEINRRREHRNFEPDHFGR
jgi:hypothetical protein